MGFFSSIQRPRTSFCFALLLSAFGACAQTAVDERLLGLSEQDVISALPDARRVYKPSLGPRGSRGLFALDLVDTGQAPTEVTFFFRRRVLERIEKRQRTPESQCQGSYASLVASLSAQYGNAGGVNLDADQNGSAAWVLDTFKVMAYRMQVANRCDLLVAIEPHVSKDASEL